MLHQEIQKLGELIEQSQNILLINHIRMDGDAWGSLGALALILKNMGKNVRCLNDDPVPPALQFLGHNELIENNIDFHEWKPDMIISLDASDTLRLGKSYENNKDIFENTPLIVIDHHISNPLFGDINIVDTKASSTCEMVVDIIQELSLTEHINEEIATFLYTGLQTDSNMYFNTNTRADTLRAGAFLIEHGANFRKPVSELYKKRTQNQVRVWQLAFSQIQYKQEGKVCSCILSREILRNLAVPYDELGGYFKGLISELMINIEGVEIAFLLYPLLEGGNKVSMRSQERYNIAEICESFGGGGHKNAAGFESDNTREDISFQLIERIREIL